MTEEGKNKRLSAKGTESAQAEFRDEDLRAALNRALRTVCIGALVGIPLTWRIWGRPSMLLFLVGALIAASGVFEWRQLMSAILNRLDTGAPPRPMGPVLFWFFLRVAAAALILYVSLRSLDGRVSALIAGLALAMLALLIEAIRLLRSWSA